MMKKLSISLFWFLALAPLAATLEGAVFDLSTELLAESLNLLKPEDRGVVEQAIQSVRNGENSLALARLSTLNSSNPQNSSLRILTAYALLQVGNLLGAFEEAKKAEASPNGNSYKCWFLANVALLTGNKKACRRELNHVKRAGDMPADVKSLETQLRRK